MVAMQLDLLDQQLAANVRGDFEEGWRIAQILERERPADRRAAFNRGWMEMWRGNLLKGFELFEPGRIEGVFGAPTPPAELQFRWSGKEDLRGKTVLLAGEGGFGDEIINVRFAKDLALRGATVVVSCHEGLIPLFSRVPGVARAVPHAQVPETAFDYWVPAMSAALPLGFTYETLPNTPYIVPEPRLVEIWKNILQGSGLKVGIRWSGNPKFEHEQNRRFSPEPLIALSELPGVRVYSLQRDADLRDLPEKVVDLQHLLKTWDDTAAAIANLDLVITSCTATAHLAAAMGKETWVIVPVLPYYIWAKPGNTSPWYKSVQLFRQEVFGEWEAPLMRVRAELEKRVGLQASRTATMPEPAQQFMPRSPGPLVPPGMALAPKPAPRAPRAGEKTLHFVAGLPRAGSTALISLLAQNPRMFGAPISGLCGIFAGIYANWDKNESHIELPNPAAKKRVLKALLESYHNTERPVVLDKNRQWVMYIALLEELLERPVKCIIPVRPLPEILASFEALRRKTPGDLTIADSELGESSTIAGRAQYFASANGALGLAYNGLKDAVTAGYLDRMLFVDYNKLTAAPKMQLRRIYDFLEEPHFDHDFNNVPQLAKGDSWRAQKLQGLHDVRPEFKKEPKNPREILGADVFEQYNQPEPWAMWT